jgi:2-dehydro-3-deoxygluconokinase
MTRPRPRIVCVGEAMVELAARGEDWEVGYGGDTLNQALHLARFGLDVRYLTALGNDPFAPRMQRAWTRDGLDPSLLLTSNSRTTGLYAISTDEQGERHFHYWRSQSAARELFNHPEIDRALAHAAEADALVYSLISLAILPEQGREKLIGLAREVRRRGGKVAFDGNYRPVLWETVEAARTWRDRAAAEADFGLPTIDDERALAGAADAGIIAAHWRQAGCGEPVVKLGGEGCRLPDGTVIPPPSSLRPVDSSGAGDAFSAGYLAARLRDASREEAARRGHALASWTIMRSGAVPPRDDAAPYG